MRIQHFLACLALLIAASAAQAFERPFPANVKRGTMTPGVYPAITIDGKPRTLAVVARVWNQDNLIEQPASLREEQVPVNYTETPAGDIDRVWILTADEANHPLPKQTNNE